MADSSIGPVSDGFTAYPSHFRSGLSVKILFRVILVATTTRLAVGPSASSEPPTAKRSQPSSREVVVD